MKTRKPPVVIVKKKRGINEPTQIPAQIKPVQLPKAYAEGYEPQVTASITNGDYNYSWGWRV